MQYRPLFKSLNELESRPLSGTEGCNRPIWSADSRHIAFFAEGKLKRVPIAGGAPHTPCEFGSGADGTWGKDVILFDGATGDSILMVPAGGGTPAGATLLDRSRGENSHGWPFFLPDGEQFVFIVFLDDDLLRADHVLDRDLGEPHEQEST